MSQRQRALAAAARAMAISHDVHGEQASPVWAAQVEEVRGSNSEWASLCRATEALLEPLDTLVLSAGRHALVDVEEHRKGPVPGPALADDSVDSFAEPR